MRFSSLILGVLLCGLPALPVLAQDAAPAAPAAAATPVPMAAPMAAPKPLSDAERAAIEGVVKDYLTKEHPEVLMEAMQELQRRDQVSAAAKSEEAVKAAHEKIFNDPGSPVGGNPKGDVTVVEFFDYQCPYCKSSDEVVAKLLKADRNVKFIYKDFPILGPESTVAAKATLAAFRQSPEKYIKLHDALMTKKDHLTDDTIYQAAKDSGVDVEKMKKDMNDDAVAKQIQANLELGGTVGVRGTPMFIVGEDVYPGALQYDQMKKAVDDARAAAKKK